MVEKKQNNDQNNDQNNNQNQNTYEFKAETKKLLNILSQSLYKHKEIFLRELISNSTDALEKIRFLTLQEDNIMSPDLDLKIDVSFNLDEKTITVSDTGIGMTKKELIENLGTIAGSGTEKFMQQFAESQKSDKDKQISSFEMIGQFGIGFYSVFMVASKAKMVTKSYKIDEPGCMWESEGTKDFIIHETEVENRGTKVILYLNDDEMEFLNNYRLESIIKKYSNFVSFPIYVIEEKKEEETAEKEKREKEAEKTVEIGSEAETETEEKTEPKPVNETQPIWKRSPSEVKEEDYKDFYHYITKKYDDYSHVIHYNVDGRVQFRSIIYIPGSLTKDLLQPETEYGLSLYSRNVMVVQNSKDVIPRWMRFVSGVVDSEDIPLNISRDTVQANRVMKKLENLLFKKFIKELEEMAENEPEKYKSFWKQFGIFVKEGIVTDITRKDILLNLLRFRTSKTEKNELIGLQEYVKNLTEEQEEIFYLVGENFDTMKLSPHLGYYDKKGLNVILFDEHVDNFMMMNVHDYKIEIGVGEEKEEKIFKFKPIDVTEVKPEPAKEEKKEGDDKELEDEMVPKRTQKFLNRVKSVLGNKIINAKTTDRLYGNACRLANPEGGITSSMQRAMRYYSQTADQTFSAPRKIIEFNPDHPTVESLTQLIENDPDNGKIDPVLTQMFENCLLEEGDLPDPSKMVPRIKQLLEMLVTGKDNIKIITFNEPGEDDIKPKEQKEEKKKEKAGNEEENPVETPKQNDNGEEKEKPQKDEITTDDKE
ncbi:MAG: molecular chaperone HtpG [Promethearchaeota archaeon]